MEQNRAGVIIAEVGSVHDGSFGNAMKLIEVAAANGADIVKFQTHIAEAETLKNAPMPPYFSVEPRFEYFKRTAFTQEQWKQLKSHAEERGVGFMSSPFANEAVDLLEEIGVTAYKIASGEVTNIPLLEHVANTGKPVYLSSGMSNWEELDSAVSVLLSGGPLTVLQCTSSYPCPPEQVGLNVLEEMRDRYGLPIGFSDHTLGHAAGIAAAARGATAIEKHITFSRAMYGSDAANSMEPEEFKVFVQALRDTWTMATSEIDKNDIEKYREMKKIFQKSIVAAKKIYAGEVLEYGAIAFKKPGNGIPASRYREVIGREAKRPLAVDDTISFEDLI